MSEETLFQSVGTEVTSALALGVLVARVKPDRGSHIGERGVWVDRSYHETATLLVALTLRTDRGQEMRTTRMIGNLQARDLQAPDGTRQVVVSFSIGGMRVRVRRACLVLALIVAVLVGATASSDASPPSPPLGPVVLPRDHGAHPAFQVEWWYTAGTVADHRGRDFFWFATVWSGGGFLVARVNVVDLRADRIVLSKEYLAPGALTTGQRAMDVNGFRLGWQPAGRLGRWSVDAPVPGNGQLRLSLTPVQRYVLNGPHGIVQEGPGAISAYYSDPRLAARGTLELNGRSSRISGQGWFDHQWGNFATNSASWHWNWFACQFQNGSDLMLYQFITAPGRPTGVQGGTFVSLHGRATHPRHFTVAPLGSAIRPAGASGTYPLRWRLEVPSAHVSVTLKARARHQFISNQYIPGFWEGAAAITSGPPGACIVESTRETASTF
jgi:predicted secreted hydrolase